MSECATWCAPPSGMYDSAIGGSNRWRTYLWSDSALYIALLFVWQQVLQESLRIPGTDVYLVHRSSEAAGYMSTIMILLTGKWIPPDLATVRLRILVEGLVYERVFEADRELKYRFAWDRRNAYNQKVYGLVKATGKTVRNSAETLRNSAQCA